jgi:hypothetical protein
MAVLPLTSPGQRMSQPDPARKRTRVHKPRRTGHIGLLASLSKLSCESNNRWADWTFVGTPPGRECSGIATARQRQRERTVSVLLALDPPVRRTRARSRTRSQGRARRHAGSVRRRACRGRAGRTCAPASRRGCRARCRPPSRPPPRGARGTHAHLTARLRELDRLSMRFVSATRSRGGSARAAHGSPPTSRRSCFTDASRRSGSTAAGIASTIGTRVGIKWNRPSSSWRRSRRPSRPRSTGRTGGGSAGGQVPGCGRSKDRVDDRAHGEQPANGRARTRRPRARRAGRHRARAPQVHSAQVRQVVASGKPPPTSCGDELAALTRSRDRR